MSKSTKLICDCGCNITITDPYKCGWFVISQLPKHESDDNPKLDQELHFASLKCLLRWAGKANSVARELQKAVKNLSPHGKIVDKTVTGLYI